MCETPDIHRCEDSGEFQLRQMIPSDLQELAGKKMIKRSLRTRDEAAARKTAAGYAAEYEQLFLRMQADKGKPSDAGIFSFLLYRLRDQV